MHSVRGQTIPRENTFDIEKTQPTQNEKQKKQKQRYSGKDKKQHPTCFASGQIFNVLSVVLASL
jgi:hypothetical protein